MNFFNINQSLGPNVCVCVCDITWIQLYNTLVTAQKLNCIDFNTLL